jgi:hypothetical protein
MPSLGSAFEQVAAFTPKAFESLGSNIRPEWLEEALTLADGFATMRRRKLPVDRALWMVIGMGLFRDRSIAEVVEHLDLALPKGPAGPGLAPGAIPPARERLGVEAVLRLFELTAEAWGKREASKERWRGLQLFGADGTCMRVPDTAANDEGFGRPGSARSTSGYPQVRVTALMALTSHVIAALSVGRYDEGELTVAQALWDQVPDQSLTILDRGYVSFWLFHLLSGARPESERHWMIRFSTKLTWRTVKRLGPGDELVEFEPSAALRKKHPELPAKLTARMVSFQAKGYRPTKVITSLLDPEKYPAKEMGALYHERWELELGYDEIKTHLLDREEALRSKSPRGIRQEIAGIAIAYNLVRIEMARVAREAGLDPRRISFVHALHLIQGFCLSSWATAPGALPRRLASLERDMRLLVLPERRTERRYPRHVKIKMSNYARNHGRPSSSKRGLK